MRIALITLVALFLFMGVVGAEETSGANWDSNLGGFGKWLNHTHEYTDRFEADTDTDTWRPPTYVPERRNPIGVGANVLLWDNEHVGVEHQYRYDWQNDEHINFLVGSNRRSLWSWITGK